MWWFKNDDTFFSESLHVCKTSLHLCKTPLHLRKTPLHLRKTPLHLCKIIEMFDRNDIRLGGKNVNISKKQIDSKLKRAAFSAVLLEFHFIELVVAVECLGSLYGERHPFAYG